ncbi:sugar porter family MFS transporter [Paraburkholderia silvatlantica]|uniref:Sugar porter (SP) family MFS transporter n=1 Tax=Paraburkholderia silvatlantica TaxID=321895 RepID=A0A2U1AAA9_9BURK|nr:sugar porter family MFS transporter [Paraburkholderia silvatlantica]MBB2928147.1 sugar porter (SP) family MFS transporter [Paraburkholderia silvatlantica]PVY31104.1 sugar porter (SP) family MFS transporter [Paraburkholderia silvatlantica]PXW37241.1 sugar porter (SP) family MFS transporter [Paraburkholderia silvatlantica]PYE19615.1 sugar porter (SP) family MFS transporter [Paraburkholderia silvatlantica]TDQ89552.1 sugar porter (SP) family MFS transporter [Paraburkholderia silvatlantica]
MITRLLTTSDEKRLSPSAYMAVIATVSAIAGGLYGYDTGIISGALPLIAHEFDLDYRAQELIAAIILLGAVIGSLASTRLSANLGRRRTIVLISAVYTIGVAAAALSPNVICLGVSRLVLGIAVGGSTQIVPTYIAELAEPDKRGRLVTYFNVAIGVGILLAAVIGVAGEHVFTWRWMIGVAVFPSLLLLYGMSRLPRSPRWLVEQGRVQDARTELSKVRHSPDAVRRELADMRDVVDQRENDAMRGWRALGEPWVRPALVAGLGVAALTQLSGIEMMIYYTPTFLRDAGFGDSASLWAALGVALTYLAMTLMGKLCVDHIGRRTLSLSTLPFAAASLFALGAVLHFDLAGRFQQWWVIGCLIAFMVFNSGGIQVIGWLTGAEIYPLGVRDQATGAHSAMLWGSNLLLTGTALTMTKWLGVGGAMWVYGALNVLAWIFIYFAVPETRGRSLEDIERALRNGTFTPHSHMATTTDKVN